MLIYDGPVSFNSSGEAYVPYPVAPVTQPPPAPRIALIAEGDPGAGQGRWRYDAMVTVKFYAPPQPGAQPGWEHGTVGLAGPPSWPWPLRVVIEG